MEEFKIPDAPKVNIKTLTNFLGADFTSIVPDEKHSPTMVNVVNNNGYIESRPGYAQVGNTFTGLKLNGCWNIDASTNIFIVHAGTKLYEVNDTFTTNVELFTGLSDTLSQGFYINNKLIIFDGTRAIIYGKFGESWSAAYLDTVGYIPTTSISRNPDGTHSTSNQDINMVQCKRTNTFLSDGVATVYQLDDVNLDTTTPTVTILNSNGIWEVTTAFTYDKVLGQVTFTTAPGISPVDGRDNISIIFSKTNTDLLNNINKCTIGVMYGYDGNNNRLFVSGNPNFPNLDWFSKNDDGTYFPSKNYTPVGYTPIVNYLLLNNGLLAIQKDVSDTDNTIYYRTSALLNGEEVFPIDKGVKNIGCISKYANSNLLNDPLTLTSHGVYGLVSNKEAGEQFANERSYYVNGKLINETNLKNATGITFKDKYYLAINNHVYVCDSRYKIHIKDSTTQDFEYEWYYWENVPVRIWFKYNEELYFGTIDGKIVKFNNTCLDYTVPTNVYYDTGFLDCNSIVLAKTVKQLTVVTKPNADTQFEIGYITEDGTTTIINKEYTTSTFPKIVQEKEKIKKFMYVKFYIKNNTAKHLSFYQIALEYIYAGKYRGE